jgi:hypothetical protein
LFIVLLEQLSPSISERGLRKPKTNCAWSPWKHVAKIWLCFCKILEINLLRSGVSNHAEQIKTEGLFEVNALNHSLTTKLGSGKVAVSKT